MSQSSPAPSQGRESAKLGVGSLVFFVTAAAAPLTILAGFIPLGILAGGQSIAVGFIVPGLVYLLFAVGFAAMARHVNGHGAFYTYISAGLHPRLGAAAGFAAYLGYLGGQIGFTASAAVFLQVTLVQLLGVDIPWIYLAILLSVAALLLAYRQVKVGARAIAVLLLAELAIVAVFCVAVLARGGYSGINFAAFSPEAIVTLSLPAVFVLTFIAFVGFEQTAIYRREAKDPRRTIPRATYLAITLLAIGYAFGAWCILLAVGTERMATMVAEDPSTLVLRLSEEYLGSTLTSIMLILMVTSFFAGILALQNACSRYLLTLGSSGLLPRRLASISPTTFAPSVANVVHSIIVVVALFLGAVLALDPYTQIIPWTNSPTIVAVLLLQVLTSIAVVRYFAKNSRGENMWVRLIAPVSAAVVLSLALFFMVWQMGALTGLDAAGNALVLAPLAIVMLIGFLRSRGREANVVTPEDPDTLRESDITHA